MKTRAIVILAAATTIGGWLLPPAQAGTAALRPGATAADESARDFTGIWAVRFRGGSGRAAPMTPWAEALFKSREAAEDPGARCLPPGVPRDMGAPYPVEFIVTPKIVYILHEYQHLVRRVFIDGSHPADLEPSYMGHSVGRWDGNTLVVDTIGLNDTTWMGPSGQPHSDQLHVVERITKSADGKTLQIETEIDDPKAYTGRWATRNVFDARPPGFEIMEYICQENNRAIIKQ